VVDEQHRFGVRERLALTAKGAAVDVLVLSATPIPRTLVLTYFGDMDVSELRRKSPPAASRSTPAHCPRAVSAKSSTASAAHSMRQTCLLDLPAGRGVRSRRHRTFSPMRPSALKACRNVSVIASVWCTARCAAPRRIA